MKLCIFGSGAVGSEIGGKLARAGCDVTLVGRGAHVATMKKRGLTLIENGKTLGKVKVKATSDPASLPRQDVVIVTVKAHAIETAAPQIAAMLHEGSHVVFAGNGIPWWYFYQHGGKFDDLRLRSVDPRGVIWDTLPPACVMGGSVYLASTVTQPGTVSYVKNDHTVLYLGEPDRSLSERCKALAELLTHSGTPAFVTDDIRTEIWHKLWGNIAFNPVTALTHATMDAVVQEYHDTDLIEAIMNEARFVAEKIGITFREGPASRIAKAATMKGHKTSMLQDIEIGKPTEIEAIVGAVREIGKRVEAETPHLNGLYSLVRLKERFYRPV